VNKHLYLCHPLVLSSPAVGKVNTADLIDLCRMKNFKSLIIEMSIIRHNTH